MVTPAATHDPHARRESMSSSGSAGPPIVFVRKYVFKLRLLLRRNNIRVQQPQPQSTSPAASLATATAAATPAAASLPLAVAAATPDSGKVNIYSFFNFTLKKQTPK